MDVLGAYIPYPWERAIAGPFVAGIAKQKKGDPETWARLDSLAARLSAAMNLPDGMKIKVHFVHDNKINAFATLGGNVIILDGLVARMPNENALAMVVAHEIAHVKHRDVITAISAGLMFAAVAAVVLGDAGWAEEIISGEGLLTTLHFSRKREKSADEEALSALVKVYGHTGGFEEVFRVLDHASKGQKRPPALLSTHPRIESRIANLNKIAERNGWPVSGPMTPLVSKPEFLR